MPRKNKTNFNIDKLKVCYQQPEGLYDKFKEDKDLLMEKVKSLTERIKSLKQEGKKDQAEQIKKQIPKYRLIKRNDYCLYVLPDNDDHHINLVVEIGGSDLGTLTLNASMQCEGLCFFKFENKALYEFLSVDVATGQKYNLINVWDCIADDLGLQFNNITELEVAADVNFKVNAQVRKFIRDFANYEMILNGKKVADPKRKLQNYHEVHSRSRQRLMGVPTMNFLQARTDAPFMRIYNKTEEVKANDNAKDYVNEWNAFGRVDTYRIEVRLKSNSIREYLTNLAVPITENGLPLWEIQQPDFLKGIWCYFSERLVYFRDKNGKKITIADLIDYPANVLRCPLPTPSITNYLASVGFSLPIPHK